MVSVQDQIDATLSEELIRSRRVVRTFTETGFDLGELPRDLFASMLTYYYNSYNNTYVEEWPSTQFSTSTWDMFCLMLLRIIGIRLHVVSPLCACRHGANQLVEDRVAAGVSSLVGGSLVSDRWDGVGWDADSKQASK